VNTLVSLGGKFHDSHGFVRGIILLFVVVSWVSLLFSAGCCHSIMLSGFYRSQVAVVQRGLITERKRVEQLSHSLVDLVKELESNTTSKSIEVLKQKTEELEELTGSIIAFNKSIEENEELIDQTDKIISEGQHFALRLSYVGFATLCVAGILFVMWM
jgi:alcohol dehydrogenase class IV